CDPKDRHLHYGDLTLGMLYAYSEDYVQGFSHTEVVHGKQSMFAKMPGDTVGEKCAHLRTAYGYLFGHPGKKHLFMGQEFGQPEEWTETKALDLDLVKQNERATLQTFIKALNHLYMTQPALYEWDDIPEGFEWINCTSAQDNVLIFARCSKKQEETLIFVCNFASVSHEAFQLGVPFAGDYMEILNSDAAEFGGNGRINGQVITSCQTQKDHRGNSITIHLAPMSVCILKRI
ncbi:MAG: alpha amylase C-terminal domain-containing protein, partial [Lachnospiraceae bacterium]|nr:alpha amylase C-terminal domain-containing protein [Lachnospiraceae bacterium]